MNEQWTVAIDLDGVLADFEGKVSELAGGIPFKEIPKGKVWALIEEYNKSTPFFESLEKMPDADELMNFVRSNFVNYFILSATGYTPRNGAEQKKNWVARKYGKDVVVKTVVSSSQKAAFANPRTILIDDREKSTVPFAAAGGAVILHTNAVTTIRELKALIGKA